MTGYAVKMCGPTLRIQVQYLRKIRVPSPNNIPMDIAGRLRVAFRAGKRDAATRRVKTSTSGLGSSSLRYEADFPTWFRGLPAARKWSDRSHCHRSEAGVFASSQERHLCIVASNRSGRDILRSGYAGSQPFSFLAR